MDSDAKELGHVHAADRKTVWANGGKREADQHRLSPDGNGHAPTKAKT